MAKVCVLQQHWSLVKSAPNAQETWDTGVPLNTLKFVGVSSVKTPEGFVRDLGARTLNGRTLIDTPPASQAHAL